MSTETPSGRRPIRITRMHYTDLVCAAMNDTTGDTQRILDRMNEDPGFQIDEQPAEGVHYIDQSVNFMYPHEIGFIEAILPPDVVYPDGLPPPRFDLVHGVVPSHHFIDELAHTGLLHDRMENMPPIVAFDVERTLDGSKVADHVRKMMLSDTYGKFKPTIVVDSCPPELFALRARDPEPTGDGIQIDPNPKRKPPPSGLLMRLMSRL